MSEQIFDFQNYRTFLKHQLKIHPKKGHGLRSVWAEAIGCQVAFVSHVLHELHHFSIEQGERLAHFLKLNSDETEYFLLLIQRDRAGTHHLRKFYDEILKKKIRDRENIRKRIHITESLSLEDQSIYYSKWLYSAIHIILTIPEYRASAQKIADYFNVHIHTVKEVLDFLVTRGLVELKGGQYFVLKDLLFLNKNSPFFTHQQVFFRQKAIEAVYQNLEENVHFSTILTISQEDIGKVKEVLLKAIEKSAAIIKPSKEEKLYTIAIDFFEAR